MRWRLDQADVEGMVRNAVLDGLGVGDHHVRLHLGMLRLELAQHLRQHELGDGRARAKQ
ncbi:hypothetical protein D3C83_169720 [compost metagenome]